MHPGKQYLSALVLLFSLSNFSIGQETPWQNIGPHMGYINSMAQDDAHPDTIYAATPYGVYKSMDGTQNWIKTSLPNIEINSIKVSAVNSDILIASTDSTIYKSANGGNTWSEIWKAERKIGAIALDPNDAQSIWAGVNVSEWGVYTENLFHSLNGGSSWNPVAFEAGQELKLSSVRDIHFDRSNHSVIYVSGWGDTKHVDGGLMLSQDGGASWSNLRPGGCSSNTVNAVSSTPTGFEPHAAYALIGPDCGVDREIFRSLDYGSTWSEVWNPFDAEESRWAGTVIEVEKEYPEWVMVGGKDNVENTSVFLYNSTEDSWYRWSNTPHSFPSAILSSPEKYTLGFNNDGVFRLSTAQEEGDYWTSQNQGMNNVEIHDIVSYPDHPGKLMAATAGSLAKTNDGGNNWSINSNSYVSLAINNQDTSILYAGKKVTRFTYWDSYSAYKSENGGVAWERNELFTHKGMLDYYYTLWAGDIFIFPDDPDKILFGIDGGGGSGEGLYLSTDAGQTWNRKYTTGVSALAMDPENKQIIYLGTSAKGYVNKSSNGGVSWSRISPPYDEAFTYSVRDLAVDKDQQVFAATSDGLFKWEGGTTWTLVNGAPVGNIPAMLIDMRQASSHIYIGTDGLGIYVSYDGGSSWEAFNNGLGPKSITTLKMDDASPPNLYAGTKDEGVWITTLETIPISSIPSQRNTVELAIYPNPNSGSFHIRAGNDSDLKGSIQISNMLGEVMYAESHIEIPAGQSRHIPVNQMTPGCYILIFKNKHQVSTKKILIEKR